MVVVVRADGTAAEPVQVRQLELLAADGVPVRDGRVDLRAVGWPSAPQEQLP
jgi:alkylated DNA nucleotide flippase Atl1